MNIEEEIAWKIRNDCAKYIHEARRIAAAVMPLVKRAQAEAWFAGYDKGNLDGYFGTGKERAESPNAEFDPYNENEGERA